jgi:hypothetical protein
VIVSESAELQAFELPPLGPILLAVVAVIGAVAVFWRLRSQGSFQDASRMTGRTATVIVMVAVLAILAVMGAGIEWLTWSSHTDLP